jgi:HSP20 family protein
MAEEKQGRREEGQNLPSQREERFMSPFEERGAESPFTLMRRFREDIDRMFSGFGFPTMRTEIAPFEMLRTMAPAVDVWETDQDVRIRADLPGVDPKDVEIYTTEDSIRIEAETKQEEEQRERGFYRTERRFGRFERVLDLPTEVQPDQAKAVFKHGVLEVILPKTQRAKERMKKIPVESQEEQVAGTKGGQQIGQQAGQRQKGSRQKKS